MYLFDESGIFPDSGGVCEEVQTTRKVPNLKNSFEYRSRDGSDEMVAQETPRSYTELLHSSQEPPDFISLEELRPRIRDAENQEHRQEREQSIGDIPRNGTQIYHHQNQQQNFYEQERWCSPVYFGDITASSEGVLRGTSGTSEGLAPISGHVNEHTNNSAISSTATGQDTAGADQPLHMEATPAQMAPDQSRTSGQHCHHHHRIHQHAGNVAQEDVSVQGSESIDERYHHSKKKRAFSHDGSDLLDDQGDDSKSARSNDGSKKQNHSEIEKRRRDKMNTYITELSAMVPMCHAMSRKLDKLTVLRMAVQHLKTILGAVTSYTEGHYKPSFLSDQELKTLILQAAEGFVFVVGCDRGRILYVSKSVSQTLNYSQGDLLGQSWFDILHPKDVAKVKEQLSSSDLSPRERLIDAKTMLPVKTDVPQGVSRLCPGARRSFFCKMKRKVDVTHSRELQVKEEADTTTGCHRRKKQPNLDWKYCVIQCTGYLKSWAPAKIELEEQEGEGDGETCNLSCLVAVGRVQPSLPVPVSTSRRLKLRTIEFISRHALDGKFLFVDQRATLVLGFLPQELLGTSMYEYYHHDDIPHLAESHKAALQATERVTTQVYRFRSKNVSFVKLRSEWKSFKNPWTKDIEYLIAKNSAAFSDFRLVESSARSEGSSVQGNYDYFAHSNGGLEKLISSHVEVSKIGRQIAEEVLSLQRRNEDSSTGSSPQSIPEPAMVNTESQITTTVSPEMNAEVQQPGTGSDNSSSNPTPLYNHIRNSVQINSVASDQGTPGDGIMEIIGDTTIAETPNPIPTDCNDEAAMSVIMNLLEADAGLGGPVDFSGLPWPLP